ncbi:MAG: acyl-ACP--UDP-N-acetylglucosamine O-acyltransferase [Thermoanaerobaculia bacterium]|nr:acyl-ACP--UDP-N-acetylglucosamine O-acyltransferase [Thermoanaerobaculia bacterium]
MSVSERAWVGPDVRLGEGVVVHPFAYLEGHTTVGDRSEIFPHAVVGTPPHDVSYRGTPTRVEIGADCVIREGVTIHRASEKEEGVTRVGSGCFLMAGSHVGHDARVGEGVILTIYAVLGGHVRVGERAILSSHCAVHQFCRVGELAMVGGGAMVVKDVPPFCVAQGDRARLVGLNEVGLERAGKPRETILALRRTYRTIFRSKLVRAEALERARGEGGGVEEVERFLGFIEGSRRGVCGHGRG